LLVGLFAAALVSAPWSTLSVVLSVYVVTIPFSIRSYRRQKRIGLAASPIAATEKKDPAATQP
ncbi:MAG TPA: CDP-diacylglycerol O-phosphatidyltransferase, partial [Rhodospirillales bacterium]|nr:CDP-diacylglycerol O-phosphatidyltransferase [Rhodospirillales bacterium]